MISRVDLNAPEHCDRTAQSGGHRETARTERETPGRSDGSVRSGELGVMAWADLGSVDRSDPSRGHGMMTRADQEAMDRDDPLAPFRDEFILPEGVTYLDGNSLGALPRATPGRLAAVVEQE